MLVGRCCWLLLLSIFYLLWHAFCLLSMTIESLTTLVFLGLPSNMIILQQNKMYTKKNTSNKFAHECWYFIHVFKEYMFTTYFAFMFSSTHRILWYIRTPWVKERRLSWWLMHFIQRLTWYNQVHSVYDLWKEIISNTRGEHRKQVLPTWHCHKSPTCW